jgi:hypothetical protein
MEQVAEAVDPAATRTAVYEDTFRPLSVGAVAALFADPGYHSSWPPGLQAASH